MVYHPAREPAGVTAAAAAMVRIALRDADAAAGRRRARASVVLEAGPPGAVGEIPGGRSGMLRLPLRITTDAPPRRLGIVPGYPRTLFEQPELRPLLHPEETEHPGSRTLRAMLHTVPVHDFVTPADLDAIKTWLRASDTHH
jgi:hypothetical protein